MERPEFAKMVAAIGRATKPKRLIVTKLDRLGRDAADIHNTVRLLESLGYPSPDGGSGQDRVGRRRRIEAGR